jgi:hypothetical protein
MAVLRGLASRPTREIAFGFAAGGAFTALATVVGPELAQTPTPIPSPVPAPDIQRMLELCRQMMGSVDLQAMLDTCRAMMSDVGNQAQGMMGQMRGMMSGMCMMGR